ncbi:MAG: chitobiase/beta-hexosaminidase C-terminal domain-containing protein, partial [Spirochaetaceae bacterium]|nr:chitobiase/beta-hexosaminidase C-terminal domain-containing protein [Spirochaetaceae bacterium]
MKAVRTPLATALVVVVSMLIGCGPLFGPEPGPGAPRFDPPAGTYDEHQWVSIDARHSRLYVTTDPAAGVLEFKPMWDDESIYVSDDMTIRAYVIDGRGLRSAVSEAAYVIEDAAAPVISSATIRQMYADYFGYDIQWDAWPADSSGDSNPSDDLTDWHNLEFAVYASPGDNIDTIEEAEANTNCTLVRDWHSENTAGGVGYAYCTAS